MKTVFMILVAMIVASLVAGCAPRSELALQDANPDAYEATRGYDPSLGSDNDPDPDTGEDAE